MKTFRFSLFFNVRMLHYRYQFRYILFVENDSEKKNQHLIITKKQCFLNKKLFCFTLALHTIFELLFICCKKFKNIFINGNLASQFQNESNYQY